MIAPLWLCPKCKITHPEIFKFCPYCGYYQNGASDTKIKPENDGPEKTSKPLEKI